MQPFDGVAAGSAVEGAKLATVGAAAPVGGDRSRLEKWPAVARWLGAQSPVTVFVLSLVNGLVVASLLIIVSTSELRTAWGGLFTHPVNALTRTWDYLSNAFVSMFEGAIANPHSIANAFANPSYASVGQAFLPLGNTLTNAIPLAISGMGLAIAYRSGALNIGAASQVIMGGIAASWVGFSFPSLPVFPHVVLALLAAMVGGALGGVVPGVLRATTGASEVIVTIMLNYVLATGLTYLLSNTFFRAGGRTSNDPLGRSTLPSATLPRMFSNWPVNTSIFVAILVLVFGSVLLTRTRLGFELQIAGASPRAARVAGIRQASVYVVAFAISGAVVGLAGGVEVLGVSPQLQVGFGDDIGGLAILVAFVGANRPLGVALAAFLYGALESGGLTMQLSSGVSYQLTGVMQSLIVMFVTAPALVASIYRLPGARRTGGRR